MGAFLANTKVSIIRGTKESPWGSVLPTDQPIEYAVPVSLSSTSKVATNKESGRQYTIESSTALIASNVDVRQGDRLLDENSGIQYEVLNVQTPIGIMFASLPATLTLRRIVEVSSDEA